MKKVAIVCNGSEATNLYPTFILGASSVALGNEVIIFFTPGATPALTNEALEKINSKGMPNLATLFESLTDAGAKLLLCDLAIQANDLKIENLREGIEISGAVSFMEMIQDANISFSF
jgi:predicted peroxiredoxin